MNLNISPELWLAIGLLLIVADMLTFTFVLFFFGVGAVLTAILAWTGFVSSTGWHILIFSALSLLSLIVFRKWAKSMFGKKKDGSEYSDIVEQVAKVSSKIPAGREGKVLFRGSEWIAYSSLNEEIEEGSAVKIEGNDGIKLKVSPIKVK